MGASAPGGLSQRRRGSRAGKPGAALVGNRGRAHGNPATESTAAPDHAEPITQTSGIHLLNTKLLYDLLKGPSMPVALPATRPDDPSSGNSRRLRVLIAEANSTVAQSPRYTLTQMGYAVIATTPSGYSAVRFAGTRKPDVVLMNAHLEGIKDGIAAADEIRRLWQIPVVLITKDSDAQNLVRAKYALPAALLSKPERPEEVEAAITAAVRQHRLTEELFVATNWFMTMLASFTDAVIATDPQGGVRFLNPAAETLTGWNSTGAIGHPIELVCGLAALDGAPLERSPVRDVMFAAAPGVKRRFVLRGRSGRETPIEAATAPILNGRVIIGGVMLFADISDTLSAECERAAERDSLRQEVRTTTEALGHTRAELAALSTHLQTAQDDERKRISRELHDDLSQRLALLAFQVGSVLAEQSPKSAALRDSLLSIQRGVVGVADDIRSVAHRLHSSVLDDLGLAAALRSLCDELSDREAIDAVFRQEGTLGELPAEMAACLYRVAQESLRNVSKHARAKGVAVNLARRNGSVLLSIEDSGVGFDPQSPLSRRGLGIVSMGERVKLANGRFSVKTAPGKGTKVTVSVPVAGAGL